MSDALLALHAVDFDWTTHIDSVWRDAPYDVPELQESLRREALLQLERLFTSKTSASPLGMVLAGPGGSGKTHLLSLLRQAVIKRGAFFVLVDMTDVRDFWEITLLGYIRSLTQRLGDGPTQHERLLLALAEQAGTKITVEKLRKGRPPALINQCDTLIRGLQRQHTEMQAHQDVLRALALFGSDDFDVRDLGWKWLQAIGIDESEKLLHGFHQPTAAPREIIRGLSFLMALAGPTLLALDQLDAIVAEQQLVSAESESVERNPRSAAAHAIIQGIAKGLIALRDTTSRTQTVVACLEQTWEILDKRATVTMRDRFMQPLLLRPMVETGQVQRLVQLRLAGAYNDNGFEPPYPTYPFKPAYFESLKHASPREVLKRCDEHRWNCLRIEKVSEVPGDTARPGSEPYPNVGRAGPELGRGPLFQDVLDRFTALKRQAPVAMLLADEDEEALDKLLEAACRALVEENQIPADVDSMLDLDFVGAGNYAPLHARVRMVYRSQSEREKHYAVRFIQKKHHLAFQARVKAAMTASGIDHELAFRKLVVFRRGVIPAGAQSAHLVQELRKRGGSIVEPTEDELRVLWALAQMFTSPTDGPRLRGWLKAEPLVSRLPSFQEAAQYLFADAQQQSKLAPPHTRAENAATPPSLKGERVPDPFERDLFVGHKLVGSTAKEPLLIKLENLAKHTVILAGAGSGKTVLVRRIVEEAALLGVPSIVIDGANDLSRLGDPWPQTPEAFSASDREKAQRYRERAEVVLWTPGREAGNPLSLEPLPDFSEVAHDPDFFQDALDMARSGLEPFLGTGKGIDKKRGVLAGALQYFAKLGGGSLREFVDMLRDLPGEANIGFAKGDKIARDMGESLLSAMTTNPLLRGQGTPLDVGVLLTSTASDKTRVSVLNLSGLPDASSQQQFVSQLATSLFTWIKKNPARNTALRGLLIVDEARDFVPSGKSVPGKDNLIRLVAQARKYGLGIVFATQAPKSIDHNVVANCSTQFFGRANSPASIETVQEQLRERGAGGADVSKLPKGTFYAFTEGLTSPVKIVTSLCLTHHPANPPDEAEIVRRAATSRKRSS